MKARCVQGVVIGSVITGARSPITCKQPTLTAQVFWCSADADVQPGAELMCDVSAASARCTLVDTPQVIDRRSGNVIGGSDGTLKQGCSSIVKLQLLEDMCVEAAEACARLGRLCLRIGETVLAVGTITTAHDKDESA